MQKLSPPPSPRSARRNPSCVHPGEDAVDAGVSPLLTMADGESVRSLAHLLAAQERSPDDSDAGEAASLLGGLANTEVMLQHAVR